MGEPACFCNEADLAGACAAARYCRLIPVNIAIKLLLKRIGDESLRLLMALSGPRGGRDYVGF